MGRITKAMERASLVWVTVFVAAFVAVGALPLSGDMGDVNEVAATNYDPYAPHVVNANSAYDGDEALRKAKLGEGVDEEASGAYGYYPQVASYTGKETETLSAVKSAVTHLQEDKKMQEEDIKMRPARHTPAAVATAQ